MRPGSNSSVSVMKLRVMPAKIFPREESRLPARPRAKTSLFLEKNPRARFIAPMGCLGYVVRTC